MIICETHAKRRSAFLVSLLPRLSSPQRRVRLSAATCYGLGRALDPAIRAAQPLRPAKPLGHISFAAEPAAKERRWQVARTICASAPPTSPSRSSSRPRRPSYCASSPVRRVTCPWFSKPCWKKRQAFAALHSEISIAGTESFCSFSRRTTRHQPSRKCAEAHLFVLVPEHHSLAW
jgi:hypothetical protein